MTIFSLGGTKVPSAAPTLAAPAMTAMRPARLMENHMPPRRVPVELVGLRDVPAAPLVRGGRADATARPDAMPIGQEVEIRLIPSLRGQTEEDRTDGGTTYVGKLIHLDADWVRLEEAGGAVRFIARAQVESIAIQKRPAEVATILP